MVVLLMSLAEAVTLMLPRCIGGPEWSKCDNCLSPDFKSNQINILINSRKEKKEIPLIKEWKVRNKLTTYTFPAHYATQTNLLKSTLFRRHLKE